MFDRPLTDDEAMGLAIERAKLGFGFVKSNPPVGCVILDKDNNFLSIGHHEKYGGPHAEINALKNIKEELLIGARVFVTLEPCSHQGKTGPCAVALASLPIGEVIFGLFDPNPLVLGKGVEILQQAGKKVTHYNKNQELLEGLCEHFLKNMREEKPFVTLKIASSIDGKIALKNGKSQWITGSESREKNQWIRAQHDAVLVGVNTFLVDNPSLNIRIGGMDKIQLKNQNPIENLNFLISEDLKSKISIAKGSLLSSEFAEKSKDLNSTENFVIVLDPKGKALSQLKNSKIFNCRKPEKIVWVVASDQNHYIEEELSINILKISLCPNGGFDLNQLLDKLWKMNIKSILVEGGGSTLSEFLNQNICDRLYLFLAPIIIGDPSGISWSSHLSLIEELTSSRKLVSSEFTPLGKDLLLSARVL